MKTGENETLQKELSIALFESMISSAGYNLTQIYKDKTIHEIKEACREAITYFTDTEEYSKYYLFKCVIDYL